MTSIALTLVTLITTALAYILCFEDTTFGGILPFLFLTVAPLATYSLGRDAPLTHDLDYVEVKKLLG